MKKKPFISVIMPVYNSARFLEKTLDSVLAQTCSDFELLAINDGSTDASLDILKRYAQQDSRIHILQNTSGEKLTGARTLGLQRARGTYLAMLDSDDLALPQRFEIQTDFLDQHPSIDFCATNVQSISEKGKRISHPWWKNTTPPIEWLLLFENPIAQSTVMLRRALVTQHHLTYQHVYAEDMDFWTRLAPYTRITRLARVLVHYRTYAKSTFNTQQKYCFQQAVRSSLTLAAHIMQKRAPALHKEFIKYYYLLDNTPHVYPMRTILSWFELLLERAAVTWQWSTPERLLVRRDTTRRIMRYLSNFPVSLSFAACLTLLFTPSPVVVKRLCIPLFIRGAFSYYLRRLWRYIKKMIFRKV